MTKIEKKPIKKTKATTATKSNGAKKYQWKAKKKLEKKKKQGLVISTINASQNWKKVANEIKTVQTRYRKDPTKMKKREEKLKQKQNESHVESKEKDIEEAKDDQEEHSEQVEKEVKQQQQKGDVKLTKAIAIDCEMVGVGEQGAESMLARVSLVNEHCECVYDQYVLPTDKITDYRTHVSGIRPADLTRENGARSFKQVQKEVAELIEGRLLVGHSLNHDLTVLFLSHPRKKIRDTQKVSKLFRQLCPTFKGGLTSLKGLTKQLLGIDIQEGEHDSVQDAQAAMRIYKTYKKEWESYLRSRKMGGDAKMRKGIESKPKLGMGMTNEDDGIKVKGSENHKRFVRNKLKKRSNFLKVFKK